MIICVTMGGKTPVRFMGSEIDFPSAIARRLWSTASWTTRLPAVLAVISRPSRIVTPELIIVPSVRVKRATAVLRVRLPMTGTRRVKASKRSRPLGVSTQRLNRNAATAVPPSPYIQ